MKKLQPTILIALILSSTFTFLPFGLSTIYADSYAFSSLEFNALDNLEILQGDNTVLMNLKHYVDIPASPLADIYRQALGASDCSIEEEMLIPENGTAIPNIVIGETSENTSENIFPIRKQFYESLSQEYDSSLGLDTLIVNSSMVPKGNSGEFRIYADALALPRVFTTIPTDSGDTWILGFGPTDSTRFAEYEFTQMTFMKMLLQQLAGEQVYKNCRSVRISLPDEAALLNSDELSGLSWLVDLGGGNCLEASICVETRALLILNETMIVTEQNTTMPIADLGCAFQGYKSFIIEYSIPWVKDGELCQSTSYPQNLQTSAVDIAGARVFAATTAATGSAVSDGDFSWSYSLKFPTLSASCDSRDGDLPDWPDDAPASSFLTYDASFDLVATFSIQWDPTFPVFGLDYFRSSIRLEAEARLNVEAGIGGWTYKKEVKIFEIPVTKVTFFIGPVPVYVDLTLGARASLDINFQVGPTVSAGYITTGWTEYGLEYDKNWGLTPIARSGMTGEFIPTTLTPGTEIVAEITLSVPIDLWAKFYAIAGPDLIFEPYIDAIFTYSLITGQVTIDVTIGLKISFVFRLDDNLKKLLKPFSNLNLGYKWDFPLLHFVWTTHHDVGITNVRVTKTYIYRGDIVGISVTIKNQGSTPQHDMESFDVKVLCGDTQIGTKSVSGLAEGSETTLDFTWDTSEVPVGEHTIKAELLNINPAEEVDENDYAKNNVFETKVEISPIDFYITYSPEKTWYTPGDTTLTTVWVKNLRGTRTSFWLGASFKDWAEEFEKYDPQISVTPESATLDPGETATFVVTWTIPDDVPYDGFKCYKIAADCWKDNTYEDGFVDNIGWAEVFYVYKLNILYPTASLPASAGDSENPNPISVCVIWIPAGLGSLLLTDTTFSVSIDNQPAIAQLQLLSYLSSWIGLYELKVTPPAHLNQGFHDLAVTATLDQLTDSDTALSAIEYATGPSAEPIQKGLAWLRTSQLGDGSWRSNVGVTALCALAFLNAGFDESDSTVQKAIQYLLSNAHGDGSIYGSYATYETSLALVTLVATHNSAYQAKINSARDWLVNSQWDESCTWGSVNKDSWYYGGFGYGWNVRPDLSNSQFALLALDASGLPKDNSVWTKAQVFLHRTQNINFPITLNIEGSEYTVQPYNTQGGYDGGFIYYPGASLAGDQKSYGSMTGAGIWGLLLSGVPKTDARVVAGMEWVKNHYTWDTNPGIGWWRPYYYYLSMSKALTMYGQTMIDGHDWYQELYDKIVGVQIDAGSGQGYWSTSAEDYDPQLTTAYAILSLQTRAVAPPVQRLSYLTFILRSNCLIRILDPDGNPVGFNYMTGLGENQIPTAVYSGPFSEPQYIVIINPKAGTYKLELIGVSEGPYTLTIQGNYGEDVTDTFEYTGEIKPAELHGSEITVTAIVGPIDIYANPPEFEEIIDNIPPTTTLEIGEPKYVDPTNNIYVSSATPFTLTAEDNPGGTGVASTFYHIYNSSYDSGWLEYSASFYLIGLTDGEYAIDYYSTDNIGNTEPTNTATVILDNTPPTTTLTIGEPKYLSGTAYVTPDTSFTLEAIDTSSGIYSTAYRIFNATYDSGWQTYTAPFYLTSLTDGIYAIEYNSTDNVGNVETTQTVTANCKTQYQITVTASQAGAQGGTFKVTYTKFGTTYTNVQKTTPWTEWVDKCTWVTLTAPLEAKIKYHFTEWAVNSVTYSDNTITVHMDGPKTATAVYKDYLGHAKEEINSLRTYVTQLYNNRKISRTEYNHFTRDLAGIEKDIERAVKNLDKERVGYDDKMMGFEDLRIAVMELKHMIKDTQDWARRGKIPAANATWIIGELENIRMKLVSKARAEALAERALALKAIEDAEAKGTDTTKAETEIAKVDRELFKAEQKIAQGKLAQAIQHFKHAFAHSQHAIKKAYDPTWTINYRDWIDELEEMDP